MEREQERELRQWAIALSEAAERQQRAMGRAILMLLGQIDSLRTELDQRSSTPKADAIAPAVDDEATSDVEADASPAETAETGLRDRLRDVARRGRA